MVREEIFGVVLPITLYVQLDEVAETDRSDRQAAGRVHLWSRSSFVDEVLTQTSSGGVTVNHVLMNAI